MQLTATFALLGLTAGALAEMCTLIGYADTNRGIFEGGGRGPPAVGDTTTGFQLYYVGGKKIAENSDNSIKAGGITIKGSDLKLPNDIQWKPNFFISYSGCSIDYAGKHYDGTTKPAIKPCDSGVKGLNAESCAYCGVDFECPSNLA